MKIHKSFAYVLILAVFTAGCAHPLTAKNISLYKSQFIDSMATRLKLGVVPVTSTPAEERLATSVANSLKKNGFEVIYPFYAREDNRQTVDLIVRMTMTSEFKGSGWNFLINWPGFVLWAPAWHGYHYETNFEFDADITDTRTGKTLPRVSAPVHLDIRHADINRTWTEISWLEVSAIAFLGGLVFMGYDKSVTPLAVEEYEARIGDYVSSKISSAIIAAESKKSPGN